VRGLPEELTRDSVSQPADVEKLVVEGRYGRADLALRRLEALIPSLAQTADDETLLLALYGRAVLLRRLGGGHQTAIAACDVLERAAHERQAGLWAAIACAARAQFRVDSGDIGGATSDLARADSALAGDELTAEGGYRLLNGLAVVYAGLRLQDRADEMRTRIEHTISSLGTLERAEHWATWAAELAARAMEPLAGGAQDPQQEFMSRAVELAAQVDNLPEDAVPAILRRGANGVRALAAAYRGRPSEALRLLGPDAFGTVGDLMPAERQIVALAAMRAHALVGSLATARSLDDAAVAPPATLPNLVLEVCRTRERLWLETYANGEVVPVLHRMTELLVRLGWRGMDLVADTARQALEHQALRTESRTDTLTGVGNRRALDEELRQILRFGPLPLALILVDVDHFKEINDRFTHVVADEVLRRVAASLSLQLRTDDQLLRYGGDEFVVLLPGTGDEEANAVAERMSAAVAARPWNELADGLEVTTTTGCAAVWSLSGRRPDADAEKLFRRADERLLAAKRERPGETDARLLSATAGSGWGDETTDDVAAIAMPPTPSRALGVEVLGPHSRPGSRSTGSGLNGGRRASDPGFTAGTDDATPAAGAPVSDQESAAGQHPAHSAPQQTRPFTGTRRSRRAARDAEAAASPVNGVPFDARAAAEAEAAQAAARQLAADRDRAATDRLARLERERLDEQARRLTEQIERERREAAARAEAERVERERQAAIAKAEAERREAEARAKAEAERRERERIERERREAEARAKAEAERREAERIERERREAEARAKAEAERREAERIEAARREAEARARAEAERLAAEKAEAQRLERERQEALAKAEAQRLERQRIERERRIREARERAAAERREREARERAEREEAERLAREQAEREEAERRRLEEVRRAAEEIRREAYERAARLAAQASTSTGSWSTTLGPDTGSWMMPGAAAVESPTRPSAPRTGSDDAERRFQQAAAEIYRPNPNLGPSTETFRALSDPLNDPVPGSSSGHGGGSSYSGNGSGYPSSMPPTPTAAPAAPSRPATPDRPAATDRPGYDRDNGYGGYGYEDERADDGSRNGSSFYPAAGSGAARPDQPSPYSHTAQEPARPWGAAPSSWPPAGEPNGYPGDQGRPASNGWPDEREDGSAQSTLPGTGRRDPLGPPTSRQAIIDLSARRRHRSPHE